MPSRVSKDNFITFLFEAQFNCKFVRFGLNLSFRREAAQPGVLRQEVNSNIVFLPGTGGREGAGNMEERVIIERYINWTYSVLGLSRFLITVSGHFIPCEIASLRGDGKFYFLGLLILFALQTEAPLVVKPFFSIMTKSELHTVMTGGFATIAGSVMAAYIGFGVRKPDVLFVLTAGRLFCTKRKIYNVCQYSFRCPPKNVLSPRVQNVF